MQRKNPGSSSLPNAPVDLTPLLDVIFIFLFVVMIGYASKAQAAENEAEKQTAMIQDEVRELKEQLSDQQAQISAYKDRVEAYEGTVVGERVKIVTVSCIWNENDVTSRQIRVLTPDGEAEPINITSSNQENGYDRLEQILEDYITANDSSVIVLSLNTDRILIRDQEAINQIVYELVKHYKYVY